jgi:hypothetical protein
VLNTFPWRGGWYDFANDQRGSLMPGTFGDRMTEIARRLIVATGLHLQGPRDGEGFRASFVPDLARRGRASASR